MTEKKVIDLVRGEIPDVSAWINPDKSKSLSEAILKAAKLGCSCEFGAHRDVLSITMTHPQVSQSCRYQIPLSPQNTVLCETPGDVLLAKVIDGLVSMIKGKLNAAN
ncbi:hypothetical protein [Planctopirus hydrillae]|uniref:Uncharacterized protein n=1 Tax=Planctopirus hydrillae TaxID=1841610 RepID=A0A1C3E4H1_9PLAN|nr:hypothetical protein [Planctopirus hydrillae]ODA28059.1 hypothetical protein A6X21_14455 [Planctopirus hydrillae]